MSSVFPPRQAARGLAGTTRVQPTAKGSSLPAMGCAKARGGARTFAAQTLRGGPRVDKGQEPQWTGAPARGGQWFA